MEVNNIYIYIYSLSQSFSFNLWMFIEGKKNLSFFLTLVLVFKISS